MLSHEENRLLCSVEGEAPMDLNYSLEPWELKAGFVLTCQAKPSSERVVVDVLPALPGVDR